MIDIFETKDYELWQGDCLELMSNIPEKSVDMILCDLPYGTTACKWDIVIPFEPLWKEYNRVIKDNAAIVLFGSEPFSSHLRLSNLKMYKYDWVWDKHIPRNFINAKIMPMQKHENIMVFNCKGKTNYHPQMEKRDKPVKVKNYAKKNGNSVYNLNNNGSDDVRKICPNAVINPLGYWTGGTNVDTGATNRKLGSDMADSVTGGGLHGKDLSKADVSVNIYAFLKAQEIGRPVSLCCAIGDTEIDGVPYSEIVEKAREYITSVGGFEKFAEWGLF